MYLCKKDMKLKKIAYSSSNTKISNLGSCSLATPKIISLALGRNRTENMQFKLPKYIFLGRGVFPP